MTRPAEFFALVTDPSFGGPPAATSSVGAFALVFEDVVLMLALGFTLALLLLLWARFIRRRRQPGSAGLATAQGSGGAGSRRRRRRAPMPRNPTRAEAGGLPPIRADGPTQPSP